MRKYLTGLIAGTALASGLAIGGGSPVLAEPTDGTITVRVVQDRNMNNVRDADDLPLGGWEVRITDVDGDDFAQNTDVNGVVTLAPGANTLTGGRYRIQVMNDDAATYSEAQIDDGHTEPAFAPAVSFINVANGVDADVSVGYVDYTVLGIDGAQIYSAVQPDDVYPTDTGAPEVYRVNYSLQGGVTPLTINGTLGSLYGIGVDTDAMNIYAGAYAKRGSLYGPGGSGAIYRVDTETGAWEQYATVADAGATVHNIGPLVPGDGVDVFHDYEFRTVVGRESLGDVEVTDDNRFLTAVNMHTDSLVVYPVQEASGPAPIQTLEVAVPDGATCTSDWAPMALAENGANLYVGAVCGADLEAYVIEYLRAGDGTLTATGVVRNGNVGDTVPRAGQTGPVAAPLACSLVDWQVWTDDVPQACKDGALSAPAQAPFPQFVVPQPMFGDLEFIDNGVLALSFRDRGGDSYGYGLYIGEQTNGSPAYSMVITTGDLVTLDAAGTDLDFANPLYDFNDIGAFHNQASFSGITSVPGSGTIVSNHMDPINLIMQTGLRSWTVDGPGGIPDGTTANGLVVTDDFGKAMGLADIEALVREAPQQIGNRIWLDVDEDGVQGPTEAPIEGVQVSLWSADGLTLIATTETDANGEYYFDTDDGLLPDTDYQIRLDRDEDYLPGGPLAGYAPTVDDAGLNDDIDSDGVDGAPGLPANIVVADITTPEYGINDHSIDFGFVPPVVSIGDYVWIDTNRDGLQDVGELPVPNAMVRLLDADGNELATTTTDANGYYAFTNLLPSSDYIVVFPTAVAVGPQTYVLTSPNTGDDTLDSDANTTTGRVLVTTPASGDNSDEPGEADNPTIDAGFVPVVSIGDYMWLDADGDGSQDVGELPVPNATVRLLDAVGNEVATTTTDANGYYAFTDLIPGGEYTVVFPTSVVVGGTTHVLTQQNQGGDALDSDANPTTGQVSVTAPESGSNSAEPDEADDPTIDAGFIPVEAVSVGDFVWVDTDRDGVQDPGEPGIPGVVLTITDGNGNPVIDVTGNPVGPVITDANGLYDFPLLPAGTSYTVTIDQAASAAALAPYIPTTPGAGNSTNDSSTGSATSTQLPNDGDRDPTLDFGFVRPSVSVGDFVWVDTDGDGLQDPGEPGIPGVVLTIRDANGNPVVDVFGNPVGPVTTDGNGAYDFANLPAGTSYTVTIDQEASAAALAPYIPTAPGAGDPATDSSTGSATSAVLPNDGDRDPTLDFGFVRPSVSVGDLVWVDTDRDGMQQPGEPGIPGVVLTIRDANGNPVVDVFGNPVGPVTTDSNGAYNFANLPAGTSYTVTINQDASAAALAPYVPTTAGIGDPASDSSTGSATSAVLPNNGDRDPTLDFGFVPVVNPNPPVTTPTTQPDPGELPATGGNVWQTLQLTALLMATGLGLILYSRRRRRTA